MLAAQQSVSMCTHKCVYLILITWRVLHHSSVIRSFHLLRLKQDLLSKATPSMLQNVFEGPDV